MNGTDTWVENWQILVGGLTAASALLAAAWRKMLRPFLLRVREVHAQVTPNGGRSVHDLVKSMADDFATMKETLEGIEQGQAIGTACQRFQMQRLDQAVYECDEKGQTIWVNQVLAELFGMPTHELLGRGWLAAVHDEDRQTVWRAWESALEMGIPYEASYRVRRGGETFEVRTSAQAISWRGKPVRFLGVVQRVG